MSKWKNSTRKTFYAMKRYLSEFCYRLLLINAYWLKRSRHFFVLDLNRKNQLFTLVGVEPRRYFQMNRKKTRIRLESGDMSTWTNEATVKMITDFLAKRFGNKALNGICHGVRTGYEVDWFLKGLPIDSTCLGTDIEPSATAHPRVVTQDFHEPRADWLSSFDFVYTNSQDHALEPRLALSTWMNQLKPNGLLLLEHSRSHGKRHINDIDVLGIETEIVPYLLLDWFKGAIYVSHKIEINMISDEHVVFVVEKSKPCDITLRL